MEVLVALIAGISTIGAAHVSTSRKLDKVKESVATSNGKTTGQYVEELSARFSHVEAGQRFTQQLLADHTAQDAANFAALEARLELLAKEMAE